MKFFNFDFETLRVKRFETEKEQILAETDAIYRLCNGDLPDQRQKRYEKALSHVTRKEYGAGGELVFRGYYCPSIYQTFAIGGCSRGKVLKQVTPREEIFYEFCYEGNDLIMVKRFAGMYVGLVERDLIGVEFIERRGDIEIGVQFDCYCGKCEELESIHVCQYDGNQLINVRSLMLLNEHKRMPFKYEKEWISYCDGRITQVDRLECTDMLQYVVLDQITFLYDENDLPVHYYHKKNPKRLHKVTKANQKYYKRLKG